MRVLPMIATIISTLTFVYLYSLRLSIANGTSRFLI
jgi:hypothetical protein